MNNNVYENCKYIENHFKICKIRKRKRRIFSIIIVLFILISLVVTYFIKVVNPIMYEYTVAQTEKLLTKSSNAAIEKVFSNYNYTDIVTINYDKDENVTLIKANHVKINEITNLLSIKTQELIDEVTEMGISIPIGTCSGISFLSGKGSDIDISINPIGNVICAFKSKFEEAGINQTIHKIYVEIESEVSIILPFSFKKVNKSIEALISECLIVGKIPNIYFETTKLNDLY